MNAPSPAIEARHLDRRLVVLAWTVALGAFASLLDGTVVTVAINRLGGEFHASISSVQWVVTGYLLALTMSIPLTGWSVERFGQRRMWLVSLGAFLVGSLLCGLAPSLGVLVASRALQGLGGGMLIPLARIIVVRAAGRDRIGRLMSVVMIPSLMAPIIGPLVGGLVLEVASWRWIFFLNVPIGVAGLEMARRHISGNHPGHGATPLDRLGMVLVSAGLAATMFGVSATGTADGLATPAVMIGLIAGPALLVGYLVHALRRTSQPLIDPRLFRDRSFAASSATVAMLGMSLFGAMLLLPLYYQQVQGADAIGAGLLLAPQGLGMLPATQVAGRLIDRLGGERGIVLAGMILAVLGTLPYGFADAHTNRLLLAVALVIRGAGLGLALTATMTAAHRTLPANAIPAAATASRTLQQVGAVLGSTVLAVILDRAGAHAEITQAAAFQTAFWWSIGFSALGFLTASMLPTRPTIPT